MAQRKFGGLKGNPYAAVEAADQTEESAKEDRKEYYRFNLKLPMEQKDYLQEMTWRTRTKSVTAYIVELIAEDMRRHPEWHDTVDELNG